jgi:Protein of unknown function (DUF4236)
MAARSKRGNGSSACGLTMPFRFRRSIRLAPGVRLNLSKSGVSTSVGERGAHVTLGHGHTRTTVGVPGSGVSYATTTTRRRSPHVTWGARLFCAVVALVLLWWFGWL